jgi:hypothetical protein
MKIDKAIKALSRGKTLQKHSRDFRHAVSVVDGGTQDLGWIAEPRINITLVNLNKAKEKPQDGPNHGLKWAMDRFDMYQRYWDRPGRQKSFHVTCRD